MIPSTKRIDVQQAADDLHRHTLAGMGRPLDRLIYLASTRDYNNGLYYHDGLASLYGQEAACQALADCHHDAFRQLVRCSLRDLVDQMEKYIASSNANPRELLVSWKKLEPYRVAVPLQADSLSTELLFSNLKVALAIVEDRLDRRPEGRAA
jgi:hypothetical protein